MSICAARRHLTTARLLLQAGSPSLGRALADFHCRNRAHLAPWDPPTAPDFHTPAVQARRIAQGLQAFAAGTALRWWISPLGAPDQVIGSVHLSQIQRGVLQGASLGYALDGTLQGQGLMHEALQAALEEAFSPRVNLHRVQAGVRPENARSLAVLARLGFEDEGLAREYLFIDGAWRDHRLLALRNPGFQAPEHWLRSPTADGGTVR